MFCKLNEYFIQVNKEANKRFNSLGADLARTEDVDENLKSTDQMKWVQLTNNIVARAKEIVDGEVICV